MEIGRGEKHAFTEGEQPARIERLNEKDRALSHPTFLRRHQYGEAHLGEANAHELHRGSDDKDLRLAVAFSRSETLLYQVIFPKRQIRVAEQGHFAHVDWFSNIT